MSHRQDARWLDIGRGQDGSCTIRDYGCLSRHIQHMVAPQTQYPVISLFLGSKLKNEALQNIFSENSPKRIPSDVAVGLHYDLVTFRSSTPMLFADSNPIAPPIVKQGKISHGGRELAFNGHVATEDALYLIYSRLLFPFVDIVCVFADDFPSVSHVANFLDECSARTLSSRPDPVRPRLLIIVNANGEGAKGPGNQQQWPRSLNPSQLSRAFSAISIIQTDSGVDRLKTLMAAQADAMHRLRRSYNFLFTASHMDFLFQSAVGHLTGSPDEPFDFVSSSRTDGGIPLVVRDRLSFYRGLCRMEGLPDKAIAQSMASALIMDYYRPDMPLLNPQMVFQTFYRAYIPCLPRELDSLGDDWVDLVEASMIQQFEHLKETGKSSVELRREMMASQSDQFRGVKSNRLCLYCLFRPVQHPAACGHSLCDLCPQLFGTPAADREFFFTVTPCGCCLSPEPFVVDVLPPTMSPTVIAIDGGGVRGVIPLEFLILVQEHLGENAQLADFVDLGVGTSSGGLSAFGLFILGLSPSACLQLFGRLARHIFGRRRDPISWLPSLKLGRLAQWLAWWLNDGCYDGRVFDTTLQETFGKRQTLFCPSRPDPSGPLISRTKVGVVATNIAAETESFVFGNFNHADGSSKECGYGLIRPERVDHEPRLWEAARATAAAPFFFPPAYITALGSFQDGGLKDNFAGGIARRISRQVWPSSRDPARMLSIGTGTTVRSPATASPHFRHVFRDGFLSRAFHAWMSSMDTEQKWQEMKTQLDESIAENFIRFNVPLEDNRVTLDNAQAMDDYRNLVVLQPGSSRAARDVALAFLTARFFFTLNAAPETKSGRFWCHGTIRCKAPAWVVLPAIQRLICEKIELVTDSSSLGPFLGDRGICPTCGRFCQPVSLRVRHANDVINIYFRTGRPSRRTWRINSFPSTISALASKQGLSLPFGRPDHDHPGTRPCHTCDERSNGNRRRPRPIYVDDEQPAVKRRRRAR